MSESKPETLQRLLRDMHALEQIVSGWNEDQQRTVTAIRESVEALNAEALRRIIRTVQDEPGGAQKLREASSDEVVYAVLRRHGILKASLQERIEEALQSVRPMLAQHGGDVELVSVQAPDTVTLRLKGACDGCPASMITLSEGVEKAIRETCPEIQNIRTAKGATVNDLIHSVDITSPFDQSTNWVRLCTPSELPADGIKSFRAGQDDLLVSVHQGELRCFENRCAHLGLPLDNGEVKAQIITCPHHGFQYELDEGQCLSMPELCLRKVPLRIQDGFVEVAPPA